MAKERCQKVLIKNASDFLKSLINSHNAAYIVYRNRERKVETILIITLGLENHEKEEKVKEARKALAKRAGFKMTVRRDSVIFEAVPDPFELCP